MNDYCASCARCLACGQFAPLPNNLASGAYVVAANRGLVPIMTYYTNAAAAPIGIKTCDHVRIAGVNA